MKIQLTCNICGHVLGTHLVSGRAQTLTVSPCLDCLERAITHCPETKLHGKRLSRGYLAELTRPKPDEDEEQKAEQMSLFGP
jgi:hypothetical protein